MCRRFLIAFMQAVAIALSGLLTVEVALERQLAEGCPVGNKTQKGKQRSALSILSCRLLGMPCQGCSWWMSGLLIVELALEKAAEGSSLGIKTQNGK